MKKDALDQYLRKSPNRVLYRGNLTSIISTSLITIRHFGNYSMLCLHDRHLYIKDIYDGCIYRAMHK